MPTRRDLVMAHYRANFAAFNRFLDRERHPEVSHCAHWVVTLLADRLAQALDGKIPRLIVNLPFFAARIQAWFLQMLPNPLLTVDQVELLKRDNVVAEGARTLADLGIQPTAAEGVIESYLYAYRPQGQYILIRTLVPHHPSNGNK